MVVKWCVRDEYDRYRYNTDDIDDRLLFFLFLSFCHTYFYCIMAVHKHMSLVVNSWSKRCVHIKHNRNIKKTKRIRIKQKVNRK